MNLGDLLIPAAAAGFVLIACALLFMRRNRPRVTRSVMRRMSRPNAIPADDITRTDRYHLTGREFLNRFYRLDLLQKLEENLW